MEGAVKLDAVEYGDEPEDDGEAYDDVEVDPRDDGAERRGFMFCLAPAPGKTSGVRIV